MFGSLYLGIVALMDTQIAFPHPSRTQVAPSRARHPGRRPPKIHGAPRYARCRTESDLGRAVQHGHDHRILESRLRPDAAGIVRRHCDYGKHGALTAFIVDLLKGADAGLLPRDVTLRVAAHFNIVFASKAEFLRFHSNTVHARLSSLKRRGLAEHIPTGPNSALWRWKRELPTLAELRSEAAALTCGSGGGDVSNAAGHQVAHQRGGNAAG